MFFYLSFLRPPPQISALSSPIHITPQITNDLRTEIFEETQDIHYSWLQTPDNNNRTKLVKLTTWRGQSSAYKSLSIPTPPGVRDGQTWRLCLTATNHSVINFKGEHTGDMPLPVFSMPILFSSQSNLKNNGAAKQEQIERLYKVSIASHQGESGSTHLLLRIIERTSYDLDKKVWDSGIGLSSWLLDLFDDDLEADSGGSLIDLKNALFSKEQRNIIELGAGTGIVTLTLASLRSAIYFPEDVEKNTGRIIATDLPSAIPLLSHNITTNSHLYPRYSPRAAVLNWDEELPSFTEISQGFDAIVMADVAYNTNSFPSLIRALQSLINLRSSPHPPPLILLGYKERDPEERTLWELAKGIGVDFMRVGTRRGFGGQAVEIWVGRTKTNERKLVDL